MSGLRKEKIRVVTVLLELPCKIKPVHNIDKAVEDISRLSKSALSRLHSKHPRRVKSAIDYFLDRVEFDRKRKTTTFFIYNITNVSKTYEDIVSVKTCRRSGMEKNCYRNSLSLNIHFK